MEKISFNQDYSYRELNKFNYSYSNREEDGLINKCRDLIEPSYIAWAILRLRCLGANEFLTRAEHARKFGKAPGRYFVHLIK